MGSVEVLSGTVGSRLILLSRGTVNQPMDLQGLVKRILCGFKTTTCSSLNRVIPINELDPIWLESFKFLSILEYPYLSTGAEFLIKLQVIRISDAKFFSLNFSVNLVKIAQNVHNPKYLCFGRNSAWSYQQHSFIYASNSPLSHLHSQELSFYATCKSLWNSLKLSYTFHCGLRKYVTCS